MCAKISTCALDWKDYRSVEYHRQVLKLVNQKCPFIINNFVEGQIHDKSPDKIKTMVPSFYTLYSSGQFKIIIGTLTLH